MRSTEGEQDGEKCVFVCVMGQGRSVCARWINVHKQHNALVWLINKLIDLFKSLLMKDIWTRRWRFYCKIDRVDTTAAASPRCRRAREHAEDRTEMERSDGVMEGDTTKTERWLAIKEKAVNKATACRIHNTGARGSVKRFLQSEPYNKKYSPPPPIGLQYSTLPSIPEQLKRARAILKRGTGGKHADVDLLNVKTNPN